MGYENAPATKLLATKCAVCRRPLVDSVSVNTGMGPDCREKHGFYQEIPEENRTQANTLVYKVALGVQAMELIETCKSLANLGLSRLAHILLDRTADVKIKTMPTDPALLQLDTPYHPDYVQAIKALHPRPRWEKLSKTWIVSGATHGNKAQILSLLSRFFPGSLALGPKGPFVIPGKNLEREFTR